MEIGAGFIGGSTSGMYTYLSPYLRYSVTPKFSLDVGGILSTGSSSLYPEQSGSSGSTSGLLFARGNYLLTERITVSGSIYKMIYPNNYYSIDQNKRYSSQNYSYSLGMNYKVTKNLSFGAQVVVNKGINYNPLFQSQPSLFGGSSFDNTQSGIFGW
jgi:long-subunit fatty acid transport protein